MKLLVSLDLRVQEPAWMVHCITMFSQLFLHIFVGINCNRKCIITLPDGCHVQSELSKWLPEENVLQLNTPTDAFNVSRRVGTQKQRTVSYRDKRAHLLAEEIKFKCNDVIIIYTN